MAVERAEMREAFKARTIAFNDQMVTIEAELTALLPANPVTPTRIG